MLVRTFVLGSLFVISAVLGACSGTGGDATANSVDGGVEGGVPLHRDGGASNGGGGDDASGDDGGDPSLDAWCAAQGGESVHFFCADFDGADLLYGWDGFTSGGSFKAVASDRSTPTALGINAPPAMIDGGPGETFPEAPQFIKHLRRTTAMTSAKVSLDLRVDATGLAAGEDTYAIVPVVIALTHDASGTDTYLASAQLGIRSTRTEIEAYGVPPHDDAGFGTMVNADLTDVPRGNWVRVEIAVSLGSATEHATATVTYDGVLAGLADLGILDASSGANGVDLTIGDVYPQFHPKTTALTFDDVLVDAD